MELKMMDERMLNSKLVTERYDAKKKIEEQYGKNSRRARNTIKKLRQDAGRHKVMILRKHEDKLKNLRKKYRKDEEEKIDQIPDSMKDWKNSAFLAILYMMKNL